jgi:hypothetical protein
MSDTEAVLQRMIKGHLEKDLDLVMTCWHPDVEAVHPLRPDRSWRGADTFRRNQEVIWERDPAKHWQVVSSGVVGSRFYLETVTGFANGTLIPCISVQEVENGAVRRQRVYTDRPTNDGFSMNSWVDDLNA